MLQRSVITTARSALARGVRLAPTVRAAGLKTVKDSPQYSAKATSKGSRANGVAKLDEADLELKMRLPKSLGGQGGGNNPEELFALGYSTCFLSALGAAYKEKFGTVTGKPFSEEAAVKAEVIIGNATDQPGFRLAVNLKVPYDSLKQSGLDKDQAKELIKEAHKLCPYSRALKGNVETTIDLV
ncbi:OsmC-like protein [Cystobasidium minutum MCA 4210]|uniref:OsmC-like protein n=1 Tax=Cystobasidium minutum MCA 4210 TaxID=1397322 RepID=UPI0034CDAB86|eukprot:jgi/Rhomi1/198349/gm1.6563_g